MNFRSRTLRNTNNFINLSFFIINILCSYLFIFMPKYRAVYEEILFINSIAFGALPIYYFYKQFSSKGKYINILPVSMKKMYLVTIMDWFIIYIISNVITVLLINKTNSGYEIYLHSHNSIVSLDNIISFLKINFLIISGMIIVKFYKVNEILVLGAFIGLGKIIDELGTYYFVGKQNLNAFFSMLPGNDYSIMDIVVFSVASIIFVFMITKLDKLSIE